MTSLSIASGVQMVSDLIHALANAIHYLPERKQDIHHLISKLSIYDVGRDDILSARKIIYESLIIQSKKIMKEGEKLVSLNQHYQQLQKSIEQDSEKMDELIQALREKKQLLQMEKHLNA